jgi:peptidyl-prolyl cis-trans isomerase D
MLKIIHKYQKSAAVYLVIVAVCLSMLFFGANANAPQKDGYAIKIDDGEIGYDTLRRKAGEVQNFYMQMFGPQMYATMIEKKQLNPMQQAVDSVIPAYLLNRLAKSFDFFVSDTEVRSAMQQKFGSATQYSEYLSRTGLSPASFEQPLREELAAEQLQNLLKDFSIASDAEARSAVFEQKVTLDLTHVSFSPSDLEKEVPEPSADALKEYYDENAADFEQPDKVAFSYIAVTPASVQAKVEVPTEDIELYYSEHLDDLKVKEQALTKSIVISIPDGASDEKKAELHKLAEEAQGKAIAGENFDELVKLYSTVVGDSELSNEGATVTPDTKPELVTKAVLGLKGSGVTDVIEIDKAFHIVNVSEYKPERTKELKEATDEIKAMLSKEEAPAYAALMAGDYLEQWKTAGADLSKFAEQNSLVVAEKPLASENEDPSAELKGLTKKIIENSSEKQQLVELDEVSVIVEVKEYKPRNIPGFDEIKDKILAAYKSDESKIVARQKADAFLGKLREGKAFTDVANELKTPVTTEPGIGSNGQSELFTNADTKKEVLALRNVGQHLDEAIEKDGKLYVVALSALHEPSSEDIEKELQTAKDAAAKQNGAFLVASLTSQLKAKSEIQIQSGLADG